MVKKKDFGRRNTMVATTLETKKEEIDSILQSHKEFSLIPGQKPKKDLSKKQDDGDTIQIFTRIVKNQQISETINLNLPTIITSHAESFKTLPRYIEPESFPVSIMHPEQRKKKSEFTFLPRSSTEVSAKRALIKEKQQDFSLMPAA